MADPVSVLKPLLLSHFRLYNLLAVYGVTQSRTRLSNFTFTFHFHALEKEMTTHSSVLAWRNLRDGGPWWAAIYGVTHSQTRLKWLSSSSSSSRWRSGEIKRGESKLASNHFPMRLPQSGPLRDVHGITQRREREEGDRGDQEEKRGNQKERDRSSQ